MEKSKKILRAEENYEKKQSMFHNPKSILKKFCKPKFSLRKILQASLPCEHFTKNFAKVVKILQPRPALQTPCKN